MPTKKVKVKVKKKKLKIKSLLVTLLIFIIIGLVGIDLINLPIKNIYITGNNILNDKTIIDIADLEDYPIYITTYFSKIKTKLLKNDYIKNVKIKEAYQGKYILRLKNINQYVYIKIN